MNPKEYPDSPRGNEMIQGEGSSPGYQGKNWEAGQYADSTPLVLWNKVLLILNRVPGSRRENEREPASKDYDWEDHVHCVAERRNSVTRPTNGNDWKRDAKAGFTGVILFGYMASL